MAESTTERVLGLHWGLDSFWCGVIIERAANRKLTIDPNDYVFSAPGRIGRMRDNDDQYEALRAKQGAYLTSQAPSDNTPGDTRREQEKVARRNDLMDALMDANDAIEDELYEMSTRFFLDVATRKAVTMIAVEDPATLPPSLFRDRKSRSQQVRDESINDLTEHAAALGIEVVMMNTRKDQHASDALAAEAIARRALDGEGEFLDIEDPDEVDGSGGES